MLRAKLRLLLMTILLLVNGYTRAQDYIIHFSEKSLLAQDRIYNLRLNEASELIRAEQKQNPENVVPDYLDVIRQMMLFLATESDQDYHRFDSIQKRAIGRIEDAPESLGYRFFLLEEVYFYTSVVEGKRGHTMSAAKNIMYCHRYGSRAIKEYPNLKAAKKTLGLITSGFGSLPSSYQNLVSFLGYETSMNKGIHMLNDFIETPTSRPEAAWLKREANFYLASVYLYLKNDKAKAWDMIVKQTNDYSTNPLSAFARVNFADKCKKNDVVISTISSLPQSKEYTKLPFMTFMMGKAKLQRLDADADKYLLDFTKQTKGKSYLKSCYQKLAWDALVKNDKARYDSYKAMILTHGNTTLEEDHQANKFAQSGIALDPELLKTRLLFDGGYYQKALDIVRPLQAKQFNDPVTKTEYLYRKGRVYHELGTYDLAKAFYKDAIATGAELSVYYASYAALYTAELFEKTGDLDNARKYFRMATTFSNNKEYKKSIEHRVKNGLERIQ